MNPTEAQAHQRMRALTSELFGYVDAGQYKHARNALRRIRIWLREAADAHAAERREVRKATRIPEL